MVKHFAKGMISSLRQHPTSAAPAMKEGGGGEGSGGGDEIEATADDESNCDSSTSGCEKLG